MENQKKRGRGRPKIYTEEELRKKKTRYMLNREWFCDICKTGRNYTLAGKHCHLKTKKHEKYLHQMRKLEGLKQELSNS